MSTSSFKLVGTISTEDDPSCVIPVKKYVSSKTGLRLYVCQIDGPVIEGYFSLATEANDDDGLPHTLEHMIFLGSENYPYSGVLDLLANKIFAAGTNAWTAVDNTTYTISTVEKLGFLQLLPIYLDHIFYPLLNESGFITEVYHINGDGEDGGVVYSEMQSVENEDENVVERALHRSLYPNNDCGYRYETGGMLHNLRTSCSHQKVCDYHKKFYRPDNMAIIVAGQIEPNDLIEVLENFEKKILSKDPEGLKLEEMPFSKPIGQLIENIEQTVYFPCDEEKNANGLLSIAWRGPHISDLKQIFSLDLLLYYLTDSSISPLYSHFISQKSYCSKIHYRVEEYKESYLNISFTNAQIENLDKIKSELINLLNELYRENIKFDLNRMLNIIKMKISEIHDKFEDSPHETISLICVGDFLYGNDQDFKQRFIQTKIFESLKQESTDYWLSLIKTYMLDSFSVCVIGKPCEKLMKSIGEEDKKRIEERKKQLGKKGLKELKIKIENCIEENDECELPDDMYEQLQVPSLENIKYKELKQFFTYKESINFEPVKTGFNNFSSLQHLQIQVDHLEGTNFVQAYIILDTTQLRTDLRPYLEIFTNVLFELPIENSSLSLTHDLVVYELNKDLLEFDVSIGINGSEFDPGCFSEYLSIFTKTQLADYELAIKWIKLIVFDTKFDLKQIQISVLNLLKEIKKRKTEPFDLIGSLANDLYFRPETNMCMNNFLRQEAFLNKLLQDLNENKSDIESKLNELRNELLKDGNIRFYLCADFSKLLGLYNKPFDQIWIENFPADLDYSNNKIFLSNQPFKVDLTWTLKKGLTELSVYSPEPKHDYIINLGSTESSFLRLISSCDIKSYDHVNYAGLLVLIEYFTQTEGPLYEAVRGPGYCYHQSIHISPEKALLELSLEKCANLSKAYEAVRKLFMEHLNKKDKFDENLLESAKNSLIFLLIDDLKSVSNFSSYSLSCFFKNVALNAVQELIKKVERINLDDLKMLLKKYLIPMFDDNYSNCLIVCHPAKSESILNDFSQKFDRKLNLIGKTDECLL